MLLALDVGNSNITIGVFEDAGLRTRWRLRTIHEQTQDEWGILFRNLFAMDSLALDRIDGVIIASVVPPLDPTLAAMAARYFGRQPMFVNSATDTGVAVRYDNPRDVGADRIVNAVAAHHKYGGPCVVVDMGTAITFDVVSAHAEYLGGIIAAGVGISIDALVSRTAKLPKVEFRAPAKLIATNTVESIQAGLYYGTVGAIDGVLERLLGELGPATRTIATGGQASLITQASRYLKTVDENLTLEGLEIIWRRNSHR